MHSVFWLHRLSPGNSSQQCPLLPCSTAPLLAGWCLSHNQLWSSLKGYPSRPHHSWAALPNRRLKTVCLQTHLQSPNSQLTNCLTRLDSSQSSLRCLAVAPNGRRSSASRLTSSQTSDHLTPTSDCWLQLVLSFCC
jgi:hypothetical protein